MVADESISRTVDGGEATAMMVGVCRARLIEWHARRIGPQQQVPRTFGHLDRVDVATVAARHRPRHRYALVVQVKQDLYLVLDIGERPPVRPIHSQNVVLAVPSSRGSSR